MKNDKKDGNNISKTIISIFFSIALAAAAGLIICVLILFLTAVIIVKSQNVPYNIFSGVGIAAACIGSFAGGFITAKIKKSMGMLWGAVCAAAMFLVLLTAGLIMGGGISGLTFLRLGLMLIVGSLGGILGVNKQPKPKYRRKF